MGVKIKSEIYVRATLLLITICSALSSSSQPLQSQEEIKDWFESQINYEPYLEGSDFSTYTTTSIKEHPYFGSAGLYYGTLVFEGRSFEEVSMKYNIYEENLLVRHMQVKPSEVRLVKPHQSKIDRFIIDDLVFIPVNSLENFPQKNGFVHALYHGENMEVFVKLTKKRKQADSRIIYYPLNTVFVATSSGYQSINNLKTLYKAFPDQRKDLQSLINGLGIDKSFKDLRNLSLLFAYLDQLL